MSGGAFDAEVVRLPDGLLAPFRLDGSLGDQRLGGATVLAFQVHRDPAHVVEAVGDQ
jgi:hypothetical protein